MRSVKADSGLQVSGFHGDRRVKPSTPVHRVEVVVGQMQ